MDPHRCYQLKQAHIADLHHQAKLARAARTRRQQYAPGRPTLPALAARRLLAVLRAAHLGPLSAVTGRGLGPRGRRAAQIGLTEIERGRSLTSARNINVGKLERNEGK
jgi:hypothetical protein